MGKKVTQLTAVTSPNDSDLLVTTTNVSTTPTSQKVTWTVVKAFLKTYFDTIYSSLNIHSLTAKTTPVDADEAIIADSAASYANKKLAWANIKATLKTYFDTVYPLLNTVVPNDGWVNPSETWTYASASTFTISGDKTALYTTGTKIKWTQTTVKYGTVLSSSYSSPNTTVTIAVNTDYTISNAAISGNYYSRVRNPLGWPEYFNFTPTLNNITVGNGIRGGKYSIQGNVLDFEAYLKWGSTTSCSGTVTLTTPVTALDYSQSYMAIGPCGLIDWANALYMGEAVLANTTAIEIRLINVAGTYAVWASINASAPFTWGTDDLLTVTGRYFI